MTWKSDQKLSKKLLSSLLSALRSSDFEEDMLKVLPTILKKEPAERSSFENTMVQDLHETLNSRINKLDELVRGAETTKPERAAAVQAAQEKSDSASASHTEDQDQLKAAKAALKAADAALAAASRAVSSFSHDFLVMQQDTAKAKDALDAFVNGPLGAFNELKHRKAPPPAAEVKIAEMKIAEVEIAMDEQPVEP